MRIVTVKVKKNDVHESFSVICRLIENNKKKIIGWYSVLLRPKTYVDHRWSNGR